MLICDKYRDLVLVFFLKISSWSLGPSRQLNWVSEPRPEGLIVYNWPIQRQLSTRDIVLQKRVRSPTINFSCFLLPTRTQYSISLLGPSCLLIIFFQNHLFRKKSSRNTIWVSSKISSLVWVQTVCKCYQQTTLVDREL